MTTPCTVYFDKTNPQTFVEGTLTVVNGLEGCEVPKYSQATNVNGFQWGGAGYQSENFFTIGPPSLVRVDKTAENTCFSADYRPNPNDKIYRGPFNNSGILDQDPTPFYCLKPKPSK